MHIRRLTLWLLSGTLLSAPVAVSAQAPGDEQANPSNPRGTFTASTSSSTATPDAATLTDDKSYVGSSLEFWLRHGLSSEDRLRSALSVALRTRFGEFEPLYVTELSYSDFLRGLDVTAQGYLGGVEGFGLGIRWDFSPGRQDLVKELRRFYGRALHGSSVPRAELEDKLPDAYNKAMSSPRVALIAGYRHFLDEGETENVGLSASKLVPIGPGGRYALLILGSAQGILVQRDRGDDASVIRLSGVLAYQNRMSRIVLENGKYQINRWNWRIGVEYIGRTAIERFDGYALFLLFRDLPEKPKEKFYIENYTEYKLSVGRSTADATFVGIDIAHTF